MAKVYILNKGGHDYSDATRFGELVYCSEGLIPKFSTSHMVRVFQGAFQDSQNIDYILLTSLSTMCSIACAIFAKKHGRLNLLIHQAGVDGKDNRYVERIVKLGDQDESTKDKNSSNSSAERGRKTAKA
jgi:hypothetical protein